VLGKKILNQESCVEEMMGNREVVHLKSPAHPLFAQVIRVTAFMIASHLDFNLEQVEDLRIAVDEACNHIFMHSSPQSQITADLQFDDTGLKIILHSTIDDSFVSGKGIPDSFCRLILDAVVDRAEIDHRNSHCTITLYKSKSPNHSPGPPEETLPGTHA
jgi:hypothetical protein